MYRNQMAGGVAFVSLGLLCAVIGGSWVNPQNTFAAQVPGVALASTDLCEVIGCGPPPAPVITEIDGVQAVYRSTPLPESTNAAIVLGRPVIIRGTNFLASGSARPECYLEFTGRKRIYLDGLNTVSGVGRGPVWDDHSVYGIFQPSGSALGVRASLVITRSDGTAASVVDLNVFAPHELRTLPMSEVLIYNQGHPTCSTAADENQCNGWTDLPNLPAPSTAGTSIRSLSPNYSAYGMHLSYTSGSSGADQFGVDLKNGWVIEDVKLETVVSSCQGDSAAITSVAQLIRQPQGTITVNWTAACKVQYFLQILIAGDGNLPW